MADVTPPGEGPPPLGHGVDTGKVGSKPAPGWLRPGSKGLVPIPGQQGFMADGAPPASYFYSGTILRVQTPDGEVEVVAAGDQWVLTRDFGPIEVNSIVGFDGDGRCFTLAAKPQGSSLAEDDKAFKKFPEPGYSKDKPSAEDLAILQQLHKVGMISASAMHGFLNKGGPVPETPEQKKARQLMEDKLALLKKEAERLEAAQDAPAPPPVPGHAGRTGRAIELD